MLALGEAKQYSSGPQAGNVVMIRSVAITVAADQSAAP